MNIRPIPISEVDALCKQFHAYGGASSTATYAFGVYEGSTLVAAYAWQPPPAGAAKAVNPYAPYAVLALSRMVAVPREQRSLKHVSKPLMLQMKRLIDRTRWPSLVTYSDEGLGHSGYVYASSGWTKTERRVAVQYEDTEGRRTSPYRNGKWQKEGLRKIGEAFLQRWEHHIVPPDQSVLYMTMHGWERRLIPGKVWKSGRPAHEVVKRRG